MSTITAHGPAAEALFADRMADWTNDDLLLTASARNRLEAEYPGALRAFDWPELRALFETIDARAGRSRKRRRVNGVICASVTTAGAALSALAPLGEPLGWEVERGFYAGAAALAFFGFLATLWLTLGDRHIRAWLECRLMTERLRQLYFQYIVADLALAAKAMREDDALRIWRGRREQALAAVAPRLMGATRAELTAVLEDVNQRRVWLLETFKKRSAQPLAQSPELDAVFAILRAQRIGVQGDYVREKLASGLSSPQTQHAFIKAVSYISALAAIGLSILVSIMLFNGFRFEALSVRLLVCLMAFIGVIAMFFKLLGEGLQVRADLERYRWYRFAVADLDARFNDPDPQVRAELLREMERASYRELRDFVKTHTEARFSFG